MNSHTIIQQNIAQLKRDRRVLVLELRTAVSARRWPRVSSLGNELDGITRRIEWRQERLL